MTSNRVYIFDTTLRDGEQSPGCSMTVTEKVRLAHKLEDLGVDILEAGFPIASEGDFEAVRAVSREIKVSVAALARSVPGDIEKAGAGLDEALVAPRIQSFLASCVFHLKHLRKISRQVVRDAAVA